MVVAASTTTEGSSQQKLNSLTLTRVHYMEHSNGCGEGKQLNKVFEGASVRL